MQDIHPVGGGGTGFLGGDGMLRPHNHQSIKCPRCDSLDTKFCYYNNYSLSQPRYFCKSCRRYWTEGSVLRNISVGGGCRKTKLSKPKASSEAGQNGKSNSHSSSERSSLTASTAEVVPASGLSSALPGCYSGSNPQQRSDQDGTIPFQQYYPDVTVEQLQSGVDNELGRPNIEPNSGSNLEPRSDQDGTVPFQHYPGGAVEQLQSRVDYELGQPNIELNSGSNLEQRSDQDGTVPFQQYPGGAVEPLQSGVDNELGRPNIEPNSGSNLEQRSDQDGTVPFQQYPGGAVEQLQLEVDIESGRPNDIEMVENYLQSNDDSVMKVAWIIFLIIAHHVFSSMWSTQNDSSSSAKAKWPFYFVGGVNAGGFISALCAIFLHPKKKVAARILVKIAAIAVACGIIVRMGMSFLPENMIWISFIPCLIPCIVVPLA